MTPEIERKLIGYATEFIKGYSEALDNNYPDVTREIREIGLGNAFFPLYHRELGKGIQLAVLSTDYDFYMFFIEGHGTPVKVFAVPEAAEGFDRDWTTNTPDDKRAERVKGYLGITDSPTLQLANAPGTSFLSFDVGYIAEQGHGHGNNFGNQAGARAEHELPRLLESSQRAKQQAAFGERYRQLQTTALSAQERGQEFERLWREVLDFYGWRPKKFRIPGEENDFTAIYQGSHILGEVRRFSEPMTGGRMREFLAKLDPRPQTIGLFISYSGFDEGALSAVRRAVNSKTVVMFERKEIEAILLQGADPGAIFDEGLRNAYDYIFEQQHHDR
jgi:hypothetical protein